MRKAAQTAHHAYDFDDEAPVVQRKPKRTLGAKPMRRLLAGAAVAICGVVIVNALTLQDQRHAAPLFGKATTIAVREEPAPQPAAALAVAPKEQPMPAPRPVAIARAIDTTATQSVNAGADPIGNAIARLEQRAPARAEASKPALKTAPKPAPHAEAAKAAPKSAAEHKPKPVEHKAVKPAKSDAIAALLKPDAAKPAAGATAKPESGKSVLAAQRALQKLGYVVAPNGQFSAGTKQAVAQFERDHEIPVTGGLSTKTMRELARLSGASAQ